MNEEAGVAVGAVFTNIPRNAGRPGISVFRVDEETICLRKE